MKKTKTILFILLVGIITVAVSFNKKDNNSIKIGVISSLTGNASYYGQSNMKGAEIGLIIAKEKYPNLKLEIYNQDSLFTPKGGIDAYKTLRTQYDIDAVITQASNVAVAVQPLAMKDGILQFSASVLANNYSTPNDLSFRLTAKGDIEAVPAIKYMEKKGYKKMAILSMTNEIGTSLTDSLVRSAEGTGVTVVAKETFSPDVVDFRTQLSKIKVTGPDVIYLASLASHSAQIMKQAKELGIRAVYMSYRAAEDPALIKNAPDLASQLVYTNAFDDKVNTPEVQTFVKTWNEKYPNEVPTAYAAEAYQSVLFMAEVFGLCGKDYVCIQQKLNEFKNHPSVFGPLSFDENGDVMYDFFFKTIKDRKFVRLEE